MTNTFHGIGTGEHAVIVLHGWFGDGASFAPLHDALDREAFRYVCMDYRGYGAMRGHAGHFTIDEIARDTLALADALGFARFSLVGHSMGAMASERIALIAPARVRALVAVAPVPACGAPIPAARRTAFDGVAASEEKRRAIIDHSTGGRLSSEWVAWKARYSMRCASEVAFAAYLAAWTTTDFSDAVAGAKAAFPVKAIVGEHDPRFHAALARETYLRWYPNAELDVLGNAGHYPMNETPIALATSIEQFLRRVPA